MKRMILMLTLAALLVVALTVTAAGALAAPKPCEQGDPGCTEKKSQRSTEESPSQGNPPENAEEPFTETTTTTKSGKGQGAQPEQNPHTIITTETACFNNSGTHEFSDPSKCDR